MVKEGYKQTEIGVIPEDWEAATLNDLVDFCTSTISTLIINKTQYIGTDNMISNRGGVRTNNIDISYSYVREYKPGDTLISNIRPYLKKIWYADRHGGCSNDVLVIRSNNKIIDSYLFWILSQDEFFNYVMENAIGTKMPRGDKQQIENYLACYPQDKKEQARIVEALSDIDELISSLEKLIAKKKAIKQGAMQQLLTGKTRLPGYKKEWKTIQIKSLGKMMGGGTPSTKNADWWNGSIPWISSSDLSEESIYGIAITRFITREAINYSATNVCPQKTVLIVSRVGVGKVAIAPCDLCTSQDFTNIIVEDHCPEFIAYIIANIMKEKTQKAQGTSIKGITSDDIAATEIHIPERPEQEAIAKVLFDLDRETETLKTKLLKMQQLKQGMMQQLLTGKIRLV